MKYYPRSRPEPTDEVLLAAYLVFGPFALLVHLVRWIWSALRASTTSDGR
jgi:hypothetical protein